MYPAAAAAAAHKRRRRDAPPLDAEAQLLLLGFLSAVVGDSTTLNQCLISAVGLETQLEQQRRAAVATGLAPPSAPPPKLGVLGSYKLAQKLANELLARPALTLVWQLQLTLDAARRWGGGTDWGVLTDAYVSVSSAAQQCHGLTGTLAAFAGPADSHIMQPGSQMCSCRRCTQHMYATPDRASFQTRTTFIVECGRQHSRSAVNDLPPPPLCLPPPPSMLAMGGVASLDDVRQHVAADIHSLLAGLDNDTLPGRRAKVEGQVRGPWQGWGALRHTQRHTQPNTGQHPD
jgi:hypothetical protein